MTKRRFTQFVYIFLLLFAQQSALTHAAWHAREHAPTQHENEGDAIQGKLCGLHGAFSQVLGGMQVAAAHQPVSEQLAETIEHRPRGCVVLELQVPLSRGPPVFS